ncbi:MAG: membrane protein insertion efficiency factor YidD [Candidatus Peribacteraceae bacterium]|nr:membrane protein insertion efficiency factor YidD [Candidatus Peribacteraceae bacterium]
MRNILLLPRRLTYIFIKTYQNTLSPDHPPSRLWRFGRARDVVIFFIKIYQNTLSPDHGPLRHLYIYGYCRHIPTCSQYGLIMIEKKGVIIGGFLTLKRLLTCVPWKKPTKKKILHMLNSK